MVPRNLLHRKELTVGGNLFLRLGQCMSVDDVLKDFTKIAAEKGIYVCSIKLIREEWEHVFRPAKVGAMIGKINELTINIEGGRTQLVVRFRGLMDKRGLYELDYAARLAAYRIDLLAKKELQLDRVVMESVDEFGLIDGVFGESELTRERSPEMALEEQIAPAKSKSEGLPVIRDGEPLKEFLCRFVLDIYEKERARLGSHSAAAQQLGMKRTTLYDWLAWARKYGPK